MRLWLKDYCFDCTLSAFGALLSDELLFWLCPVSVFWGYDRQVTVLTLPCQCFLCVWLTSSVLIMSSQRSVLLIDTVMFWVCLAGVFHGSGWQIILSTVSCQCLVCSCSMNYCLDCALSVLSLLLITVLTVPCWCSLRLWLMGYSWLCDVSVWCVSDWQVIVWLCPGSVCSVSDWWMTVLIAPCQCLLCLWLIICRFDCALPGFCGLLIAELQLWLRPGSVC